MKKEFIQSIKIITLSLVIGLGVSVVYATDWVAPLSSAPTCTSGNPGCDAPINVGPGDQSKSGGLAIGTTDAPGIGQLFADKGGLHVGLTVLTRATNSYPALEIGDSSGTPTYPRIQIDRFKSSAKNVGTWGVDNTASGDNFTYPAPVCADSNGYLILCPAPSGTVDLALSETSYNQQYTNTTAPSASRSATLTWTVPAGASCIVGNQTETPASTVTGWPVGYTINSSGSASVTFTRYGTSTLTLTCDYGGGTPSDTVTYTYNGTDTFTSNGSFTVPTAVTSMTFKAVGGGGGGADAGTHDDCNPDPFCVASGIDGTNTVIDWTGGSTLDFTANKGTHGFECTDGFETCSYHGYVPSFILGTPGNGSATNSPTVYGGAGSTSGSTSIGLSSYGNGGSGTGVRYGGGSAAISTTKTVTPGNSFTLTIGQGGDGGADMLGIEADGVDGVVQFSW